MRRGTVLNPSRPSLVEITGKALQAPREWYIAVGVSRKMATGTCRQQEYTRLQYVIIPYARYPRLRKRHETCRIFIPEPGANIEIRIRRLNTSLKVAPSREVYYPKYGTR